MKLVVGYEMYNEKKQLMLYLTIVCLIILLIILATGYILQWQAQLVHRMPTARVWYVSESP